MRIGNTIRNIFWPLSVVVTGLVLVLLVLISSAPPSEDAEAVPDERTREQQIVFAPYPETQTAIAQRDATVTAGTATARAIQTQTYPLTEQAAQTIRAGQTLSAQPTISDADRTATIQAATNQAATATPQGSTPDVAAPVAAATNTPTATPLPNATPTYSPTPNRNVSPISTPSNPTPTYTPTPTPTETGSLFLSNGSTHECLTGKTFTLIGNNAPPLTALILAFNGRIVGGGITDSEGMYTMPLTIGAERPGSYLVHVLVRQSRVPILYFTCVVRADASIPPLPSHPWGR